MREKTLARWDWHVRPLDFAVLGDRNHPLTEFALGIDAEASLPPDARTPAERPYPAPDREYLQIVLMTPCSSIAVAREEKHADRSASLDAYQWQRECRML